MADEFDPDAFIAATTPAKDVGPTARRAAAGKPPEPAAPSDADLGIANDRGRNVPLDFQQRATGVDPGMIQVNQEGKPLPGEVGSKIPYRPLDPMESDPLAQAVVAGVMGAGASALIPGAGVAASLARGAVGGGTATAVQGGSAKDIAVGAALGGGLAAMSPLMAGAAKRGSERLFQEYGQAARGAGKLKTLGKLEKIGPDAVADVLQRNEIGSIADAGAARAATQAALAKTGQQMGAALDVIDAAPARVTLGDAMTKLEALRAKLAGDAATRPLADTLHGYMKDFWEANGGKATAPIAAKALHSTVSQLEATGYGGSAATLSPAAQKVLARQTAGVLDGMLDEHIAAVAKANPAAAEAAKQLDALTHDYTVLKTVQPIVTNQAIAQRFAAGPVQRATEAMAHPVKSAAKVAIGIPARTLGAAAAGIDTMLAKLYSAPVVTPELAQEAIRSGVAPGTLQAIMSMRTAREATP